jgi:thymidylate kinase
MIEDKKNKGFISLLFENLCQKKISYIILRNYENLPDKPLEGSDVDLLIAKDNEEKYSSALKEAILKSGSFILLKIRQSNCLSYFIYQKEPFPLGTWIDAFWELSTKSFIWADSNFLLQNRRQHQKGFFISPPGGEAATLFVKEVLSGPFIKERYRLRIPDFVRIDKENFIKTLEPYFNKKIIQEMVQICLEGKWEEASKRRKSWWNHLVFNCFLQSPFSQSLRFVDFIFSQFKKLITQKGVIIAVLGPDGVGKTTICEGLKERAKNFFFKKVYQYHSHFGFFPELGKISSLFFGKRFSKEEKAISQEKPIGLPRAALHLFYYGLENFLAWPWILWLKMRGNLILFDRYFYDFIATNTHRKIPFWLFSLIAKIIPKPDLVFIIKASPEIIYKRKKELSFEEIKRQLYAFQDKRISKLVPTVFIDNEGELDVVLNKIEDEILKMLSKKYEGK